MIKVFGIAYKLVANLIRVGICATILLLTLIQMAGLLGYWFVLLDSVNHFQPFWIMGSFFLFIAVLAFFEAGKFRNWLIGILAFCISTGLLLTGPDLTKKLIAPSISEMPSPLRLKVMTFNLWAANDQQIEMKDYIFKENPDVIMFQEFVGRNRRLSKLLASKYRYQRHCNSTKAKRCALSVFSRHPLGKMEIRQPVDARRNNRFHGYSLVTNVAINGAEPIVLITTHPDWPLPQPFQRSELDDLSNWIKLQGAKRVIVAGDFNSTSWSFELSRFKNRSGLVRHSQAIMTYPKIQFHPKLEKLVPFAFLPLDHVFSSKDLPLVSIKRGLPTGSDHYPIIAEFDIGIR